MPDLSLFDPSTPWFDRAPDELWLPYSDPEQRRMRDLVYGTSPEEFDEMIDKEELSQDLVSIPRSWLQDLLAGSRRQEEPKILTNLDVLGRTCRPRRERVRAPSKYISRREFWAAYEAVSFANYCGVVFNVELTILWEVAGFDGPKEIDEAFVSFMERYRKFDEHRYVEVYYYAAFENGEDKGYHSHIHLFFPHHMKSELRDWLNKSLRTADGSAFFKMKVKRPERFVGQWRWFQYTMKGLDPRLTEKENRLRDTDGAYHQEVGLRRQEETGLIAIKRVRFSRSIAPSKRAKAGYKLSHASFMQETNAQRYGKVEYERGFMARVGAETTAALQAIEIV